MKWLLCLFLKHKESVVTEIRQFNTRKGNRYVRKEYRHTCDRCGLKSDWIRWKHYPSLPKGWDDTYNER